MKKIMVLLLSTVLLLQCFFFPSKTLNAQAKENTYNNDYVATINFDKFKKKIKEDDLMLTVKKTLLNANKYALNAWYKDKKHLDTQEDQEYYNLYKAAGSSVNEYIYRFPAGQAFGLAVSLKTGAYDESYTGVSEEDAKNYVIKLSTSVAYAHKSNGGNYKSWGDDWQAAHWAYYAGYAAWLFWDDLNEEQRKLIQNMITHEADRFINKNPDYWKLTNGKELYPGDSKIEEDGWNSELLNLASHMLPQHEHADAWYYRMIEYQLAAFATPEMNESDEIIHGRKAKDWVYGYNVNSDGTVINHNLIHPVYNASATGVNSSIVNSLVGEKLPLAAKYNLEHLYSGLTEATFTSPPYDAPGGTMYVKDSSELYYPQGSDWGKGIYDTFANIDISAYVYGYGKDAKKWAKLHANKVLEQQGRYEDGHTYEPNENSYLGREEAISTRMGSAYMTLWLNEKVRVKFSNKPVEFPHKDLPSIGANQEYAFASESTYVRGGSYANTSYYPTDVMEVKNDGGEASSYSREGYLKFDLSEIKSYPKSAMLYIPVVDVGSLVESKNITNSIELVDDNSWSQENLTFKNKPLKTGKIIETWTPNKNGLMIDISEYVKKAYDSDGKLSLRIFSNVSSSGDTFVRYGTSRQADPNYIPRLTLTY
ncbi:DNRLRE domain-containing protein [Neobacillus sp. WH10]|uniref:CBM96 family carbohydrate-binding protein n=1 Tax=Neobacillus sp. WH10 TaxID=3047873 RepID=UPI0024C0F172|nr:DNRLRE domain-containing protein [Neobacillus sp. WH10]WHY77194.1 DNRLRE domain-containing protein [Neobacillus sp. WH10]